MILPARKCGGFSLIELAIITTIIGLLISAAMQTYRTYMVVKVVNDTSVRRSQVEEALARHLFNFNFLPCPAGAALAPDVANAGKGVYGGTNADPDCAAGAAVGTCNANGVCVADGARHSTCNPFAVTVKDKVFIGSVPYFDLGISVNDSLDGWGNRMTYAISQYLTKAATYNELCGAINVQSYTRSTDTISNSFFNGVANSYLFVLLSHGEDAKGAYNYYGQRRNCTAGARDTENCNNDATFLQRGNTSADNVVSHAAGADFYDDAFLSFDVVRDRDKWSRVGLTSMRNKSTGRVGIGGIPDASNNYSLDVVGNIKLQDFQADTICANGGYCFPQSMIGGSGVSCNGGLVTGIANSAVSCVGQISTTGLVPGNCPAGQLLKGFTALGGIICLAP